MLEKVDLAQKLEKRDYKRDIDGYRIELGTLQRKARDNDIPVIIVFEGWDAAGKGTIINRLLLTLDPRHYTVHTTLEQTEEEKMRPFLWRHWIWTPERGRFAVFDRSWYRRVLLERVNKTVKPEEWDRAYSEICSFERQLVDDGYLIIKFFLHISKKEQKKRFKKLMKDPSTKWKVTKDDLKHHKQYEQYCEAIENMLARTDTDYAPWTVVEAHDHRFATVKVFKTVIAALERRISERGKDKNGTRAVRASNVEPVQSVLHTVDLSMSMSREEYDGKLDDMQKRIWEIEHEIYTRRIPVVIVYQGWDAAGKGGNIRRLVQRMDPRGYEVIPVGAPNDIERAHHYLWRFWCRIPKAGHIAIFDRSWYGRVLVERVEGLCREDEWRRAYREINEMEKQLVDFGTVLIKFWLQIDKEEQLSRFQERERTIHKKWKITEEDWRNREKWDLYKNAVDEMLFRTSTNYAPWTIVESNCKLFARIKALKTVIREVEKRL